MYAVEKKYEIEMKLKKEMTNIQELKAAANRSTSLANDVCNVLGACEQRLQQLENAVKPLYGDSARLQQIHHNMEKTVKALDDVINYYMVARELVDVIGAGPHTSSPETLNTYLEALDKLVEAQTYFNKNNAQSVELENINQLYNTGISKLENAFDDLLSRNTRPLSPSTLMDMIALEEDSSVDSVSVSNSGSNGNPSIEALRAAGGWLSAAGRPPIQILYNVRAPAAKTSLNNFRDYLRNRSDASPIMRAKSLLNRSDSTKKTSKIQKVLEKRANKIMLRASQTLEQSTGLAIGPRRSNANDIYTEDSGGEILEEYEAELAGTLAACVCRIARAEQRFLLGLVPLPKLPQLITNLMKDCFAVLAADVEKCVSGRRVARGSGGWALVGRLGRLAPDVAKALNPAPPHPYTAILQHATQQDSRRYLKSCQDHVLENADFHETTGHTNLVKQPECIRSLDEWLEYIRNDTSAPSVDGTVHQLAAAALTYLQNLAEHVNTLGPALASEPQYNRALNQVSGNHDRNAALLAVYMCKVLAQLNLALRNKSEQYPDALRAIFLLNNTLYLLQGLQRSGLLDVLMLSEPECEKSYRDLIHGYKNNYLQSWNKLLTHLSIDETFPAKLRDRDRQIIKDKFSMFNREFEECSRSQRGYSVPDAELRETLKRDNKEVILPPYTKFYDTYAHLPFSKNPDKYVKYNPVEVATQLNGYFDEAA